MSRSNQAVIDALLGRQLPVEGLGFVELLDVMGDDQAICDAARRTIRMARKASEDRDLIRYMLRHAHGTPFEMCQVKLLVEMPLVFKNQMIRHRAASLMDESSMWQEPSVNEFSGRYSEFEDRFYTTPAHGWREQTASNRQGSGGFIKPTDDGIDLSNEEHDFLRHARSVYEHRLAAGVAKEQARKDLPVSQVTQFVWCCDLRNVLHFLGLRMDSHAQQEIREYANVIGNEIVAKLFPISFEAFRDYHLEAMTLSRLDVEAIWAGDHEMGFTNKREREECRSKMVRLGLLTEDNRG